MLHFLQAPSKDGPCCLLSVKVQELLGRNDSDLNKPLYEILTTDEGKATISDGGLKKSNRKI